MASSTFNARSSAVYEHFMGRWSAKLGPQFINFAGVGPGDRVLDVGCGTGNLALCLKNIVGAEQVTGIDLSESYLSAAKQKAPEIQFQKGDVTALAFPDASFDAALAMLVLQFVPPTDAAIHEMKRVVRTGGVVAAAVWDSYGAFSSQRIFWDAAGLLGIATPQDLAGFFWRPLAGPGELAIAWSRNKLENVEQSTATIRMEFDSFEDYWSPIRAGEALPGKFYDGLSKADRSRLETAVASSFHAGRPDGPRSFSASAWVCRGTV